jgi:hypothetical protein
MDFAFLARGIPEIPAFNLAHHRHKAVGSLG